MTKKIAIDWDEQELRLVAAQCSGNSVKVTDAAVVALDGRAVKEVLRSEADSRGWGKADALVAIGRGKAELRELQLPPVPDDELPDMVRFQAVRSFASAGESATVDFLVTSRHDTGIEMIAAAIGPARLSEVKDACQHAGLEATRISLRPLSAAALFAISDSASDDEVVLIDLLTGEAEIVIFRDNKVVFVRTVRLPVDEAQRPKALAGELKRSLLASGSEHAERRVVLWGRADIHQADVASISQSLGADVETIDPFSLVDVDRKANATMPDHVGRLAPLVGLLAADELHADRLVDFLNPRKRPDPKSNRARNALLIGVPVAAVLLLGFLIYRQLSALDTQITMLEQSNASLRDQVKMADQSVAETEMLDAFLDGDVNWLAELQRFSETSPSADQLMVRTLTGKANTQAGGGTLTISGIATSVDAIKDLEESLRDDTHQVVGDGVKEERSQDAYRFAFKEMVTVPAAQVREQRYAVYLKMFQQSPVKVESTPEVEEQQAEREQGDAPEVSGEPSPPSQASPPDVPVDSVSGQNNEVAS